jgi:hypothetical protein
MGSSSSKPSPTSRSSSKIIREKSHSKSHPHNNAIMSPTINSGVSRLNSFPDKHSKISKNSKYSKDFNHQHDDDHIDNIDNVEDSNGHRDIIDTNHTDHTLTHFESEPNSIILSDIEPLSHRSKNDNVRLFSKPSSQEIYQIITLEDTSSGIILTHYPPFDMASLTSAPISPKTATTISTHSYSNSDTNATNNSHTHTEDTPASHASHSKHISSSGISVSIVDEDKTKKSATTSNSKKKKKDASVTPLPLPNKSGVVIQPFNAKAKSWIFPNLVSDETEYKLFADDWIWQSETDPFLSSTKISAHQMLSSLSTHHTLSTSIAASLSLFPLNANSILSKSPIIFNHSLYPQTACSPLLRLSLKQLLKPDAQTTEIIWQFAENCGAPSIPIYSGYLTQPRLVYLASEIQSVIFFLHLNTLGKKQGIDISTHSNRNTLWRDSRQVLPVPIHFSMKSSLPISADSRRPSKKEGSIHNAGLLDTRFLPLNFKAPPTNALQEAHLKSLSIYLLRVLNTSGEGRVHKNEFLTNWPKLSNFLFSHSIVEKLKVPKKKQSDGVINCSIM